MKDVIHLQEDGNAILVTLTDQSLFTADFDFSKGLKLMLENIRKEWAGAGAEKFQELMDYVYSTAPMVSVKSKYEPQDQAPLDLVLEREKLLQELGA